MQFGFLELLLINMCVATPVKIKSFTENGAILDNGREVDLSLISDVKEGDWLLCHADLAINKIDEKEAKEILRLNKLCSHKDT